MRVTLVLMLLAGLTGYSAEAQQECSTAIPASTPTAGFTDHGDATVTHIRTGLMWKRCLQGLSGADCTTGTASTHNWQQALQLAETQSFAGHVDWRLPDIKELASIVELSCNNPAINLDVFPNDHGSVVWSGSPYVYEASSAWVIPFDFGNDGTHSRSEEIRVRLVRNSEQVLPDLKASPRVIESGNESTLSWNTGSWVETSCELTGGELSTNPLLTDGGDLSTGSISISPTATTYFTLTCGALSDSAFVEVIGGGGET